MKYDFWEAKQKDFQFYDIEEILINITECQILIDFLQRSLDKAKSPSEIDTDTHLVDDMMQVHRNLLKKLEKEIVALPKDEYANLNTYLQQRNAFYDEGAKHGTKPLTKDECAWAASATRAAKRTMQAVVEKRPIKYQPSNFWKDGTLREDDEFSLLEATLVRLETDQLLLSKQPLSREEYAQQFEDDNEQGYADYLAREKTHKDFIKEMAKKEKPEEKLQQIISSMPAERVKKFLQSRQQFYAKKYVESLTGTVKDGSIVVEENPVTLEEGVLFSSEIKIKQDWSKKALSLVEDPTAKTEA